MIAYGWIDEQLVVIITTNSLYECAQSQIGKQRHLANRPVGPTRYKQGKINGKRRRLKVVGDEIHTQAGTEKEMPVELIAVRGRESRQTVNNVSVVGVFFLKQCFAIQVNKSSIALGYLRKGTDRRCHEH